MTASERLRLLADWFDMHDRTMGRDGHEVQDDLRKWAEILEGIPHPEELPGLLASVKHGVECHEPTFREGATEHCFMCRITLAYRKVMTP